MYFLPYLLFLILTIVYSISLSLMSCTLYNCIFFRLIALRHCTRLSASSFLMTSLQRRCGQHLGRLPAIIKSFTLNWHGDTCTWHDINIQLFTLLDQAFLSILWRWPKYLSLHDRILSGRLTIPSFWWSSCVLTRTSSWTPQIQQIISMSIDLERWFVSLGTSDLYQSYSEIFLIQGWR